jgi:hypothetical protein
MIGIKHLVILIAFIPKIPNIPVQTNCCEFTGLQIKKESGILLQASYPQVGRNRKKRKLYLLLSKQD